MRYIRCDVCNEAYFLSEEARCRHQSMCLAVKEFIAPATSASTTSVVGGPSSPSKKVTPSKTTSVSALDLSASSSSSSSPSNKKKTTSMNEAAARALDLSVSPAQTKGASAAAAAAVPSMSTHSLQSKATSTQPVTVSNQRGTPATKEKNKKKKKKRSPSPTNEGNKKKKTDESKDTLAKHPPSMQWELRKGLSSARNYRIANPGSYYKDIGTFLEAAIPLVAEILEAETENTSAFKYNLLLEAAYSHPIKEDMEVCNFKTTNRMIQDTTVGCDEEEAEEEDEQNLLNIEAAGINPDILRSLLADARKLLQEETNFLMKGSGWSLETPLGVTLRVSRFKYKKPSGEGYVQLPKTIQARKAVLSVRNTDNRCFEYSLLAKHIPGTNFKTILTENSFTFNRHTYDFTDISFPISTADIRKFEKRNPNTSVNVYECDPEGVVTPLRVVDNARPDHSNLLLYKHTSGVSHYALILDLAKLIKPQIAKGKNHITVCNRCFCYKETRRCHPSPEAWLASHTWFCQHHKPAPITLPTEDNNILKFEEYHTQIPLPIIVIGDFESSLKPIDAVNAYELHEANSFCTIIKSTLPESILMEVGLSSTPYVCRSNDAGRNFLQHIRDIACSVETLYTRYIPIGNMSQDQIERHDQTTSCDLCSRPFNEEHINSRKTLDHCHITGQYRHTLCSTCNTKAKTPNFVPVYFHNFTNYDQAFIVRNLATLKGHEISVIPSNSEKLISLSIRIGRIWIRFLDSFRMMSQSLATLANNLPAADMVESSKLVPHNMFHLVKRKGVYPYSYVKDSSVFEETKLPPQASFKNTLSDESISDEDYAHALDVWEKLEMKTFWQYHEFYLKLDVCLLADILSSFRSKCLTHYHIDCCHEYTAPGLAFRAMMRMTQVNLELLTDPDHLLFVESAVRGGLTQVCMRYCQANNHYLERPSDYDPSKPISQLLYLDAVNLYGFSMTQNLPYANFKWVDPETVSWANLPDDSPHGLILECDVEVPDAVHDRMQDLPPLPETSCPPGGKSRKLLATLTNKHRYVAHYVLFKQALSLGLKITKVYRALQFSQAPWMRKFIEYNANLRQQSSIKFDKEFFKLINNASFGKTMEQIRNRVEIKLVTTDSALQKLYRQARYVEHKIISETVVLVHMRHKKVFMNKPIYVGMSVLDLSKVRLYQFHYSVMREHFKPPDSEITLAYVDTDGLLYYVNSKHDVFEILKQPSIASQLDRSQLPDTHPLKCDDNAGKLGTFKDECKGRAIYEYVGLRPKMYALRYNSDAVDDKDTKLKAKGIKMCFVNNKLKFQHYIDTLFDILPTTKPDKAVFNTIRCKSFKLTSTRVVKKSLSSEDDKRYILPCGIRTLPWGHYQLRDNHIEEDGASSSGLQ